MHDNNILQIMSSNVKKTIYESNREEIDKKMNIISETIEQLLVIKIRPSSIKNKLILILIAIIIIIMIIIII